MSSIKQQSVAKGMRWAARIIGLLVTLGALFAFVMTVGSAVDVFQREGFGSREFLAESLGFFFILVAATGYIISWWKVRLGGALLVSVYFMIIAGGILDPGPNFENVIELSIFCSPFLVTGVLFLIAWWLSTKASSSSLSSSTLSSNTPPSQS